MEHADNKYIVTQKKDKKHSYKRINVFHVTNYNVSEGEKT
jgi:hypothetical protein